MLAKNVNDNAFTQGQRGVNEFFASKLAPTEQRGLARYAADFSAKHLQLFFDALVATVYVVDAVD
ncbi:MAG: hypothetical protein K0S85_2911, partial [Pseudomonas orientalis]|nr:hypothetical protein [Pseudomonas orientalis]